MHGMEGRAGWGSIAASWWDRGSLDEDGGQMGCPWMWEDTQTLQIKLPF